MCIKCTMYFFFNYVKDANFFITLNYLQNIDSYLTKI